MPRDWNFASKASAKVNLPSRFMGSAMTKSATIHPAKIANGIQEAVVPVEGNHAADAEKRSGRKVVARKGDTVHKPGYLAMGGKVPLRRLGFTSQKETDGQA